LQENSAPVGVFYSIKNNTTLLIEYKALRKNAFRKEFTNMAASLAMILNNYCTIWSYRDTFSAVKLLIEK